MNGKLSTMAVERTSGPAAPTYSVADGSSLAKGTTTITLTSTDNTVYYKWSQTASAYVDGAALVADTPDGNGTSTVTATAPSTTGTWYLYAVAYDGTSEYSDVKCNTYTVAMQEVTAVTINGTAISASDLETLNSTKALAVDGTSLNGLGDIVLAMNVGSAPTVARSVASGVATYTYTLNEEEYTVTLNYGERSYGDAQGSVVYYDKNGTEATGVNTASLTANGITFAYPSKTYGYGSSTVVLGSDTYKSIKLSTGEGTTVTFPEGKKATKVVVYGWSAAPGGGYLKTLSETNGGSKAISTVGDDKFYATNDAASYPSVYEYELDAWESMYFFGANPQPFVVMDFVFASAPIITTQPVSANYAKEASATALSVAATSSDADAVSYQWYSCTDATGSGAAEISGETSASYTPSTTAAGVFYYFCRVTDGNGTTDTDVVTIKVTAETSSTLFSMAYSSGSLSSVAQNTETDLSTYFTLTGGSAVIGNTNSDASKAQITDGSGVYYNGNDAYVKITLTSGTFQVGDKISIVGKVNTAEKGFYINNENSTSSALHTTIFASKSTEATVTATIDATRAVSTLYIKRESGGTYLKSLTITRAATKTLTTNAGGWTSFTPEWNCTLSEGATAYIITAVDETSVTAETVDVLEVGKGYFVKGDAAKTDYTATATDDAASATTGNLIVGCPTATVITAAAPDSNDKYVLGTATTGEYAGKSGLFKVDSSVSIAAGKAYLNTQTTSPARFLSLDFDGETTGVSAALMDNGEMIKDKAFFNLNGQRVSQPTRGLYIVNGKKVIIK